MKLIKTYETNSTIEKLNNGDIFSITDPSVPPVNDIYIRSTITLRSSEDTEQEPEVIPIYVDIENGNLININNGELKIHVFENPEIILR